jgi:hypothetical protein
MNLAALIARLDQNVDRIANDALAHATAALAGDIREALSTPPGGPHDYPWLQTGALHASVGYKSEGPDAVIGSTSDTARHQEHGTITIPPRPVFAPLAANAAPGIATEIAQAVMTAMRGT